ncbi:MAG: anti-sigma regulatory factor [Saprospiraceae bacterium]|nr:anti-sigma regulatory factor [Saprospiraceae bacterium]
MLNGANNNNWEILTNEQIETEFDIVTMRGMVRHFAKLKGLGIVDQTRITTAVSELLRNMFQYAGGGTFTIETGNFEDKKALIISCIDNGPGIPDLELAMKDGYTSGAGMGYGLPGAKRLVDNFEIETEVNKGTKVRVMKWI